MVRPSTFIPVAASCLLIYSVTIAQAAGGGGNGGGAATGGTGSSGAASPSGMGINDTATMTGRSSSIRNNANTPLNAPANTAGGTSVNPFTGVPVGQPLQPNDLGFGTTGGSNQ